PAIGTRAPVTQRGVLPAFHPLLAAHGRRTAGHTRDAAGRFRGNRACRVAEQLAVRFRTGTRCGRHTAGPWPTRWQRGAGGHGHPGCGVVHRLGPYRAAESHAVLLEAGGVRRPDFLSTVPVALAAPQLPAHHGNGPGPGRTEIA